MPHVTFRLRPSLDVDMALEFLRLSRGGVDFSQGIVGVHPELEGVGKLPPSKQRRKVQEHFDAFYAAHRDYLQRRSAEMQKAWDTVEKEYRKHVEKILPGLRWPAGRYVGYLSVIDCNPRFLHNKTFQVFYLHPDGSTYVAAHELLHFAFYHYCRTKMRKRFAGMNTEQGTFWHLAELFNDVILGLPEFVRVHGRSRFAVYPEHRPFLAQAKSAWRKNPSVEAWTETIMELLEKDM